MLILVVLFSGVIISSNDVYCTSLQDVDVSVLLDILRGQPRLYLQRDRHGYTSRASSSDSSDDSSSESDGDVNLRAGSFITLLEGSPEKDLQNIEAGAVNDKYKYKYKYDRDARPRNSLLKIRNREQDLDEDDHNGNDDRLQPFEQILKQLLTQHIRDNMYKPRNLKNRETKKHKFAPSQILESVYMADQRNEDLPVADDYSRKLVILDLDALKKRYNNNMLTDLAAKLLSSLSAQKESGKRYAKEVRYKGFPVKNNFYNFRRSRRTSKEVQSQKNELKQELKSLVENYQAPPKQNDVKSRRLSGLQERSRSKSRQY